MLEPKADFLKRLNQETMHNWYVVQKDDGFEINVIYTLVLHACDAPHSSNNTDVLSKLFGSTLPNQASFWHVQANHVWLSYGTTAGRGCRATITVAHMTVQNRNGRSS